MDIRVQIDSLESAHGVLLLTVSNTLYLPDRILICPMQTASVPVNEFRPGSTL